MFKNIQFILILLFFFVFCKKETIKVPDKLTGITVFKSGQVFVNELPLALGKNIEDGQTISVKERSKLDLQIIVPNTEIVIRLKEKTNLEFNSKQYSDKVHYYLNLKSGKGLFNVNSPIKEEHSIHFTTPTAVLGIRGTQFSIDIDSNGNSKIALIEGKISYKPRIPELDSIPSNLINENSVLKKNLEILSKQEWTLEKGNVIEITTKDNEKIVQKLGLSEIIKETDPAKLKEKVAELKVPVTESELSSSYSVKPKELSIQESSNFLDELKDLTPVSVTEVNTPGFVDNVLKPRAEKITVADKERLEKKYGGVVQTFTLKNKTVYTGILERTSTGVRIITPDGIIQLSEKEAEDMEVSF